jgi:hypothetical protein
MDMDFVAFGPLVPPWLPRIRFLSIRPHLRYGFLQAPPRGDALASRLSFTSIRLDRRLAPPQLPNMLGAQRKHRVSEDNPVLSGGEKRYGLCHGGSESAHKYLMREFGARTNRRPELPPYSLSVGSPHSTAHNNSRRPRRLQAQNDRKRSPAGIAMQVII